MKKNYITYYLTFQTPIHIGDYKPFEYGTSLKHVPSDTLMSAFMAVRAVYGLDVPNDGNPGFVVSSLFPFMRSGLENHSFTYFFPKPLTGLPVPPDKIKLAKKLKKIAWVDSMYLSMMLSGQRLIDYGGGDNEHINSGFLSTTLQINSKQMSDNALVYSSQVSQRVSAPRFRSASDAENRLFTMERIYFNENAGLYFLFEGNERQQKWLEESLDLLAQEGIGTDRNVGHGSFSWKSGKVSIDVPDDADHFVTLGLLHPESRDSLQSMIDEKSAWKLVKRGGWITDSEYQTITKRSVYMFSEGSVFKKPGNIKGQIGLENINLQPQTSDSPYFMENPVKHPVWRCGRSLILPMKLN